MENQEWLNYKIEIRERIRKFALKILDFSELLSRTERELIINHQLSRSGTSMYTNYRAALRGRSKAEFFSKLSVAVEKADETEMWLELTVTSGIINDQLAKELHSESLELLKLLASMRKRSST